MDCGICYAYRLDGKTPDKVCDNSRCGRFYHQACLYEVRIQDLEPHKRFYLYFFAVVTRLGNVSSEFRNPVWRMSLLRAGTLQFPK